MTRIPRQYLRILVALVIVTAPAVFANTTSIQLTRPGDRSAVPWRPCVDGIVSDPGATVHVIVHPMQESTYWVAPAVTRRPSTAGAGFRTLVYIGDNTRVHRGQRFEIMAVADPRRPLREGDQLPEWPEAAARSSVVEVVRDDSASDDCDQAAGPAPRSMAAVVQHDDPDAGGNRRGDGAARAARPWWWLLAIVPIVLLVRRDRTEAAMAQVAALDQALERVMAAVWRRIVAAVVSCAAWARGCGRRLLGGAWQARGLRVAPRQLLHALLLAALLVPSAWLAFLVDIRTIESGVGLVLAPVAMADGGADGLFAEPVPESEAMAADDDGIVGWSIVWQPVQQALQRQFGAIAIGLAALQGGFGVVLLLGMTRGDAVRLRLRPLLSDRPVSAACFLALDLTLAAMAAVRGYEFSPSGAPGMIATTVALAMALVAPWLLALIVHVLLDLTSECSGWIAHLFGLLLAVLLTAGAWVVAAVAVLAMATVPALVFGAARVACAAVTVALWFIDGLRDVCIDLWRLFRLALSPVGSRRGRAAFE